MSGDQGKSKTSAVGATSVESKEDGSQKSGGWIATLLRLNIYEAMLLTSLACVIAATVILFVDLSKFGNILEYPWRVSEFRLPTITGN